MSGPVYIDAEQLCELLPFADAVAALRAAFAGPPLDAPQRVHQVLENGELLLMPAADGHAVGVKLVTLCPENPAGGLPLLHGLYVLFEGRTLRQLAVLDGAALTALRTAAVSGLGTELLAAPDARHLCIFGAGRQAHAHLDAMCAVRPVEELMVVEPDAERADALLRAARDRGLRARRTTAEDVGDADLICTCTTSTVPVLDGDQLSPGVHINAMGSYKPSTREVDTRTVLRARVVVETREAALAEAGDLLQPIAAGQWSADRLYADLHELTTATIPPPASGEITLFKSVGVAFEDLAVARAAWGNRQSGRLKIGAAAGS